MLLSIHERYITLQYVLIHAGGNSKKTDQMLELQKMLSAQLDGLRDEKGNEKRAAQEERASKNHILIVPQYLGSTHVTRIKSPRAHALACTKM